MAVIMTDAEMGSLSNISISDLSYRLIAAGLGIFQVGRTIDKDGNISFSFDNGTAITKTDILNALNSTPTPTLTLSSYNEVITADGTSTSSVTITDSRGTGASGIKIGLLPSSSLPLSPSSPVLDSNGNAVITLGPQQSGIISGNITIRVSTEDMPSRFQILSVRFV